MRYSTGTIFCTGTASRILHNTVDPLARKYKTIIYQINHSFMITKNIIEYWPTLETQNEKNITIKMQWLFDSCFISLYFIIPIMFKTQTSLKEGLTTKGFYIQGIMNRRTYSCKAVFFQEPLYSRRPLAILRHKLIQRGSSLQNMYITLHTKNDYIKTVILKT